MQPVTLYEAVDKKLFWNEKDCIAYELKMDPEKHYYLANVITKDDGRITAWQYGYTITDYTSEYVEPEAPGFLREGHSGYYTSYANKKDIKLGVHAGTLRGAIQEALKNPKFRYVTDKIKYGWIREAPEDGTEM